MKKIIVCCNQFTNIGNAFYMLSVLKDLSKVYQGKAQVIPGEDIPPPSFKGRIFRNLGYFQVFNFYDIDWYVISGPVFYKRFSERWSSQLELLSKRGVRIVIMSAGSNYYDQEEVEICRKELKRIKPYLLITRDSETFQAYNDLFQYSYNGICAAFFSSFHFQGIKKINLGPYAVFGFETSTEPKVQIYQSSSGQIKVEVDKNSVEKMNKFRQLITSIKSYPSFIDNIKIIRPHHGVCGVISNEVFNRPNRHFSLNPYSYLDIYSGAEFTLSQRVHACVASLSYGNRAMLFKDTKRCNLFKRTGVPEITQKLVSLPNGYLEMEYQKYLDFLRTVPI
ncbi:MAG: polysaccharide pyruvyl transferase family protein [Candidatus Omnitrophica bacterium]|nr:polysaccharide pyruvyl transferase family protein [Candidatus Omnitrophota bacterium]